MPVNKAEIGGRILKRLLKYGQIIESNGTNKIKIGRNIIRVAYHSLNFATSYNPSKCSIFRPSFVQAREERRRATNHALWVYFKGKLDFYKDFSMFYIFTSNDDGSKRLRSIQERQFHNENFSYWTTVTELPLTEEKIHSMLYDALNIAFGYNNDEEKFNKLIQTIEMKSVSEV